MRTVAITQRVTGVAAYAERRDGLDQAWARFMAACGLMPLPLPNVPDVALAIWHATAVDTHKTDGSFNFTVSK